MVQIQIRYAGELRCDATHGPSSTRLVTDAPVDNQGRGESFSPTDLLATALGTCMLTIMGITAQKRGWTLAGTRVAVTKHMLADPVRRVSRLEVLMRVPGEFEQRERELLLAAARSCPVAQSLGERVEVALTVEWGVGVET
jgi:putative redox protein